MRIKLPSCLLGLTIGLFAMSGGCPRIDDSDIEIDFSGLAAAFNILQEDDPRAVVLPPAIVQQGDTVIIDNSVTVIVNPETQLIVEELPDQVIIGFENLTGFDFYLKYLADGEEQGVFVFDGETLLLEYPCLDEIELISEDDIDPNTGVLVQSFDLSSLFERGPDFLCGDAVIITIDEFGVTADIDAIDLLIGD